MKSYLIVVKKSEATFDMFVINNIGKTYSRMFLSVSNEIVPDCCEESEATFDMFVINNIGKTYSRMFLSVSNEIVPDCCEEV